MSDPRDEIAMKKSRTDKAKNVVAVIKFTLWTNNPVPIQLRSIKTQWNATHPLPCLVQIILLISRRFVSVRLRKSK